jgi:hypothetical protein
MVMSAAAHDFDVLPEHAVRLTGPERLHRRFLRGEAAGEVRSRVPALGTICNLTRCKHALQETLAVAVEQVSDTRDIGGVQADAEDIHDRTTA